MSRNGTAPDSHVLLVSAHASPLDRRIVSEANTLAASGRSVTLYSTPLSEAPAGLTSDVATAFLPDWGASSLGYQMKVGALIPNALTNAARTALYSLPGKGPAYDYRKLFLSSPPSGEFNVIHCHDLHTLPAAVALREEIAPEAKLVYDSHELFPCQQNNRSYERYWTRVEKKFIGEADLVIAVNDSVAEEMAKRYGVDRPEVIYNSCEALDSDTNISREEFLAHFGAQGDLFTVFFHGAFASNRNLEALVLAFASLKGTARLLLLGGGEMQPKLEQLLREKQLENVLLGPWISPGRLLAFLSHADLGIIPYSARDNLNNLYCTPNKLFEYIEAKVPICANDLPELRNFVAGNDIGAVYKMDTAEEIATALRDCIERCQRGEFTAEARAAAREKFSWDRQAEKLLTLYETLGV